MKLWLCRGGPSYYWTFWAVAAPDAETARLYHPRGRLKWSGSRWEYLPGKAPVYDERYCHLEPDGSFDPYKVGTLYYDQTKGLPNGPEDVTVLRCLGEASADLQEGVAFTAAQGVERTFWVDEQGVDQRLGGLT